jgi:spore coat protein CotH
MAKYSELFKTNEEKWYSNLQAVEQFIEINNTLPSKNSKDKEVKSLGMWLSHQKENYKTQQYNMQQTEIHKAFESFMTKYSELFITNKEKWFKTLQAVEHFIEINNKLPTHGSKDQEVKSLGEWLSHQKKNYKKQQKIMKQPEIRETFENFMLKYPHLFLQE